MEERDSLRQQIAVIEEGGGAQNETIKNLEMKISLLEEQIKIFQSIIDQYKDLDDRKNRLHEKEIKAVTPSFMDNAKLVISGMGLAGIIFAIISIL